MARRKPGCGAVLLAVYLALLGASHLVRLFQPRSGPGPTDKTVALPLVSGDERLERSIELAYLDRPGPAADAPCVVLLHGSPGRKGDFSDVIPGLVSRFRVIAPDLPGFGGSAAPVPDYSTRAHARYVLDLLDELQIERAHVVGFSMGGGVALEMYDLAPPAIRSVTLLSAIGVQELELLGSYELNHLVHAAQLGLVWTIEHLVPHFGLVDGHLVDPAYARNFYDTDQRPLRRILQRFEPPMLILHGEHDFLVPAEAAREHHRLVPHSELQMLDANHFMVFLQGEKTAERLVEFLDRVEQGDAPNRVEATTERLAAASAPFDLLTRPPATGFGLILLMALIGIATLVSEDLTCVAVGLMVGQGRIDFLPGVIACFLGIYVGDLLLFLAGRLLGRPALRRVPLCWWISEDQVEAASSWLTRRGPLVIVLSRFFPGARLPTYFAAGSLRTSFLSFSFYFFVAVAVWTPLLVGLAMALGMRAYDSFELFREHSTTALLLLGVWIFVVIKLIMPLFTSRGRRRWVGRWRRWTNSEFWPPWVFYPPVVLYALWLSLRHRSPLLFTAANPAMPASGFIAESKWEILDGLRGAGDRVARTRLIESRLTGESRVEQVRSFLEDEKLDYPVVLKPNTGQRGSGVLVAHDEEQVRDYLQYSDFDTLVQEYAAGDEFGVFYYRYPDEPRGQILSITAKRMPVVIGDGGRTLEQLILADRRAVCMASHYFERQQHQLQRVPEAGESIRLVELGTHCRGAIFLDGGELATEPLRAEIDRISRGYDGFFFGRYDLKVSSGAVLAHGKGFKIIELNGVTSEATHIYDPKISLFRAYGILFEQWRIAYEIGRRNRARGVRPVGFATLVELLREYRRTSRRHPAS